MTGNLDQAAVRDYRTALGRVGRSVTLQRVSGQAPRTVTFSATVQAVVGSYADYGQAPQKTGYGESSPGGISQGARQVILLAEDLRSARFPLPVRKNDRLILNGGDKMNIVHVDAEKRSVAGALELTVVGVP